jgi:hypothetical protein
VQSASAICDLILHRDTLMRFVSTLDPIFDLSVTLGESRSDLVAAAWAEWSDCRRKMNDLSDMELVGRHHVLQAAEGITAKSEHWFRGAQGLISPA